MPVRLMLLIALGFGLFSSAMACGPFFPWQVLGDREAVLHAAPANGFVFQVSRIMGEKQETAPNDSNENTYYEAFLKDRTSDDPVVRRMADALVQAEQALPYGSAALALADYAYRRFDAERDGLSKIQIGALVAAAASHDGNAAYAASDGLPEADRQYLAGAADFAAGHMDAAVRYFKTALAEPDQRRAIWAQFMIGRSMVAGGDETGAIAAFQATRALAKQGAPDPLDLAAASYGDEARLALDRARSLAKGLPNADATAYAGAIDTALRLYAEGALHGSRGNLDSLVITLKEILASPLTIRAASTDVLARRLLVAFVAARADELPEFEGAVATKTMENPPAPRSDDPGTNDRLPIPGVQIAPEGEAGALLDGIDADGAPQTEGADQLAALAYRAGRYELAARAAKLAPGPVSSWVLAKLALRDGKMDEAGRRYAEAASAFPAHLADLKFGTEDSPRTQDLDPASGPLDVDNRALLEAERAILGLSRGEYVQALDLIYPAAPLYWGDVAYIAERVLTIDELGQFVDRRVPAPPSIADGTAPDVKTQMATNLRWLLARRLFRERRYDDALAYFPVGGQPDIAQLAREYSEAMKTGSSSWWPSSRAAALFRAATLARDNGMELLGTEGPPDFNFYEGNFDDAPFGDFRALWNEAKQTSDFGPSGEASPGEIARVAASNTRPDTRFHYREIAADLAVEAAHAVPRRSQAYAAILCHAAGWMGRDPVRAQAIYRDYVAHGARVPWATHFGSACPAPDFKEIGRARWRSIRLTLRSLLPPHWRAVAAGGVILLALGAVIWVRRRRSA